MTGVIVTSSSCSGTCLTFSIPRHANVIADETALALGGLPIDEIALRTAASSAPGPSGEVGALVVVGMVCSELTLAGPPSRSSARQRPPRRGAR